MLSLFSATNAFMAPAMSSKLSMSKVIMDATRDPAPSSLDADWDGVWGFDRQKVIFEAWDPESPRTYTNFNPFERNLDGAKADANGCFPGESRGYQPPLRPDVSFAQMQEEKVSQARRARPAPQLGQEGLPGLLLAQVAGEARRPPLDGPI